MFFSVSCAFNIDPLRLANIRVLFELFGCLLVPSHVSVIEVAAVTIMTTISAPATEAFKNIVHAMRGEGPWVQYCSSDS
jgi:hypothetical protein